MTNPPACIPDLLQHLRAARLPHDFVALATAMHETDGMARLDTLHRVLDTEDGNDAFAGLVLVGVCRILDELRNAASSASGETKFEQRCRRLDQSRSR